MKPYGREKKVKGGYYHGSNWKVDCHCHTKNHRKLGTWWEEFSENYLSRTAIKKLWKKEVENDLL